ncbi:hypothetical protein [Streptomyces sp. NPDC056682]|uniref:hypothetical protein n=1 Tax=Streptomyces sp. NPDC056682 TaxID=3345909 RepID=UPI0036CFDFF2
MGGHAPDIRDANAQILEDELPTAARDPRVDDHPVEGHGAPRRREAMKAATDEMPPFRHDTGPPRAST